MEDFKENAQSVMKILASSKPWETCLFYMRGIVFGSKPGEQCLPLFHFEGYNVRQVSDKPENKYELLSREIVIYKHLESEEILQIWKNPFTGKETEVVPVDNDPVNIPLPLKVFSPFAKAFFPKPALCTDFLSIRLEIFLHYPNFLSPDQYPDFSVGPIYEGAEFFQYISPQSSVRSGDVSIAPTLVTWFRVSQWLPWMQMGSSGGRLIYACGCQKFKECQSLANIAPDLMEFVNTKHSKYLQPPQEFTSPNETSWSAFKKLIDGRRERGESDVQLPTSAFSTESEPKRTSINNLSKFLKDVEHKFLYAVGPAYMKLKDQKAKKIFHVEGIIKLENTSFNVNEEVLNISCKVHTGYKDINNQEGGFLQTWKLPDTEKDVTVEPFSWEGSVDIPFINIHIDEQTANNNCLRGLVKSTDVRVSDAFVIFHTEHDRGSAVRHSVQGSWLHVQPLPEWMSDAPDGELFFHLAVYLADDGTTYTFCTIYYISV